MTLNTHLNPIGLQPDINFSYLYLFYKSKLIIFFSTAIFVFLAMNKVGCSFFVFSRFVNCAICLRSQCCELCYRISYSQEINWSFGCFVSIVKIHSISNGNNDKNFFGLPPSLGLSIDVLRLVDESFRMTSGKYFFRVGLLGVDRIHRSRRSHVPLSLTATIQVDPPRVIDIFVDPPMMTDNL